MAQKENLKGTIVRYQKKGKQNGWIRGTFRRQKKKGTAAALVLALVLQPVLPPLSGGFRSGLFQAAQAWAAGPESGNETDASRFTATPGDAQAGTLSPGTPGSAEKPAGPELLKQQKRVLPESRSPIGDLWEGWDVPAVFNGDGTPEAPYQIGTLSDLMALSAAVAAGESFEGVCFELTADIDMAGLNTGSGGWNPIGWYQNRDEAGGEVSHPFSGTFDGGGRRIRGLRILREDETGYELGLFGRIDGGTVKHLTVEAEDICGMDRTGVLVGSVTGDAVLYDITVSGYVSAASSSAEAFAGGVAGRVDGCGGRATVENCRAEGIVVRNESRDGGAGGIAGTVREADLADNEVYTMDGSYDRIYGRGYTGGIAGIMADSCLYNSYADGTIGGNGSRAAGGIVGRYESGNLILARFAGEIGRTGSGTLAREGTFIGTREDRDAFTYGTEKADNLAYLYTNSAVKARNVCGSGLDGDNTFSLAAHVGYWTDNGRKYVTVAGVMETGCGSRYFYEELEDGVRHIVTTKLEREFTADGYAKDLPFALDHFAPGYQGEPVRGYLLSVPRIDAKNANGTYDTDVAYLTAVPETGNTYYRAMDKDYAAAVAPGAAVSVTTAAKNSGENYYQMIPDAAEAGGVKPPVYIDEEGRAVPMTYTGSGSYTFQMPECDTEINVSYQKVTTQLTLTPEEIRIQVVQTRTGDRKNPEIRTEVYDDGGVLIARYLNGATDQSVEVQPVRIHAEHNSPGGSAGQAVRWMADDTDLLTLVSETGYTLQDAEVFPNLSGSFIQGILQREEKNQANHGYMEPISSQIYEKSAVVTAASDPAVSAGQEAVYGNCRVTVSFQIVDQTTRRVEGMDLNSHQLVYTVTRRLTGDRLNPEESLTCTEPAVLEAGLLPEQPFYKQVTWRDQESGQNLILTPGGENGRNCTVQVRYDPEGKANPAWIQNVINADNQKRKEDPYGAVGGTAVYEETVTASSEDQTHGVIRASCQVTVYFVTEDETEILPERLQISQKEMDWNLTAVKTGDSRSETVQLAGADENRKLDAALEPACPEGEPYEPYDRSLVWTSSDPDALAVDAQGNLTVNSEARWIQEAEQTPPYKGEKTVEIRVSAGEGQVSDTARIHLRYETACLELPADALALEMELTRTGRRSSPKLTWTGGEPVAFAAASYPESMEVTYTSSHPEIVAVDADGRLTPVQNPDAPWLKEAVPGSGEAEAAVTITARAGSHTDTCQVTVHVTVRDQTYSGGGSGGGTGGGSTARAVTPTGAAVSTASLPSYVVSGTWIQNGEGRWLFSDGTRTYAGEWAAVHNPYADSSRGQSSFDWFRFGADGFMVTGWYLDADGNWYYLNPVSDNTKGRMAVGWNWIPGEGGQLRCYYFHEISDGTRGALFRNGITPDGYEVDTQGAWTVNGEVQIRQP